MKRIHIAYAGCSPEFAKKLKLAADLLSSQGYMATTDNWKGRESQLLVVDETDPFGSKVAKLARQWGIPVLPVSGEKNKSDMLSLAAPVHIIFKAISKGITDLADKTRQALPSQTKQPPLDSLLNSKTNQLEVRSAERLLAVLDYESGLCKSSDKKDLLEAQQTILRSQGLVIDNSEKTQTMQGVQLSIENFLFNTFVREGAPVYPTKTALKLDTWPDIRSTSHGINVAQLSAKLLNQPYTLQTLEADYPAHVLHAYFWAIHGARLVSQHSTGSQNTVNTSPAEPGKVKQALSKLVSWLGGQ